MSVLPSAQDWAVEQFGTANLGDRRRTRRLVAAAAALAAQPERALPQVFDWNALRGFYRLCHQTEATVDAVAQPHWDQTRAAMRREPLVLILHDTTELDYTHHPAARGLGPIGDGRGRGLLQHNSLAVVPAGRRVLGLSHQQLRTRQPAPREESTYRRRRRPRESDVWRAGITAAGPAPAGCCWVDVGDRGGDIYEAMRAARDVGHHFLFRASQDRVVFTTAARDATAPLLTFARSLPAQATDRVDIPRRGGRPARTAAVALAAAPVGVPAPRGFPQQAAQPVLDAWVVRVWEPDPPAGVAPLEWVLLSSCPAETAADLRERRDWYACRPLIEVYHDIEKNGCREEARRFATADRLETCLAVLAVVAVRMLQLRGALAAQPDAPAAQVATASEAQVVRRAVGHRGRRFTVRDFVRGVARLGGFLGRRRDGEPGVRTLWRGYQRLQDVVLGYHLRASPTSGFA
jgi:hypothetical protein